MFKDLFTHEDLLEAEPSLFGFGDVTMLRDFGPLKKGDKFGGIWFNTEESKCQVYAEDGEAIIHQFQFRLEA